MFCSFLCSKIVCKCLYQSNGWLIHLSWPDDASIICHHITFSMFVSHVSFRWTLPFFFILPNSTISRLASFIFVVLNSISSAAKCLINDLFFRYCLWALMITVKHLCLQPGHLTKIFHYQILLAQRKFWLRSTGKFWKNSRRLKEMNLMEFCLFTQRKTLRAFTSTSWRLLMVTSIQHLSKWIFIELSL